MTVQVAAAAIVRDGRVLAARRVYPADVSGGWELPGGKVDRGETAAQAVVREIAEELGCHVEVVRALHGRSEVKPGYELTAHLCRLTGGEPVPHEHDAVRWLGPEELHDVRWLPADHPFLAEIRELLLDGSRLAGGNVGGAVRIGSTVRRGTGPWTPAVHALLAHLHASGLDAVPRVLGEDERGREVLTYLPGRVVDVDTETASDGLLADAMGWLRRFHDVVDGFTHPGPWRTTSRPLEAGEVVCHHDFAPYNCAVSSSAVGERLVGVFDWDMAGPGTRLEDLAFAAWNWVPLFREDQGSARSAQRLLLMATGYGGPFTAGQILGGVESRIERSVRVIRQGQQDGDPGMLSLGEVGEPERTARALDGLRERVPEILAAIATVDPRGSLHQDAGARRHERSPDQQDQEGRKGR